MEKQLAQKTAELIKKNKFIVIASVDGGGQPWNTPVASFRSTGELIFYWASHKESQHSKNIHTNSKVFIIVNGSGSAEGVYIMADAFEVNDDQEVMAAAKVFGDDKFNPSDGQEYLGNKPRRIYKATPKKVWVNVDKTDENGKFLYDTREEISLQDLANQLNEIG